MGAAPWGQGAAGAHPGGSGQAEPVRQSWRKMGFFNGAGTKFKWEGVCLSPNDPLVVAPSPFSDPSRCLVGFFQSFLIPVRKMGERNPAPAVPGGLHRHQGAPSPRSHSHQI